MKTKGALLWGPGTSSGWSVEEIELDEPNGNEGAGAVEQLGPGVTEVEAGADVAYDD